MNKLLKTICALCCLLTISLTASSQMTLIKNNKPAARIVCPQSTLHGERTIELLNLFIERISGVRLPIEHAARTKKGNIFIGEQTTEVGEDGFVIECKDGNLFVRSGGGKGSVYAIVTLLERYLGVSYYAKETYTLTRRNTVILPAFRDVETPAFRYRQTRSYGNDDPVYKDWFRLKDPHEFFASNLWVHTFDKLLPASVYGKKHPEYYSLINGKRRPGNHSQWCLTNSKVFEIVAQKIDSIFKANPGMKIISISQNDGNDTYCTCPKCKAVDEYEGSPSGNLIYFMNKLAKRFPDKEFSTLAYLYSVQPPKHVRPLPNVNIMLCDIDCKREVPITDNESGREFLKALEGWGKISNNIFVWDYGINFDNLVSPFPNFHILQKNIRKFKKNNVTMLFEQVNGELGVDFAEMRAYMLAKLMWNPEQNTDSLMKAFMKGYYGKAAPYLYQYQKTMEGALLGSGIPLWIYDSPVSHKNGMLNPYLLKTYNELFDKAESAVKNDTTLLKRVRISRLPLQYSELEIARTIPLSDKTEITEKTKLFKKRTSEYGVESLTERGISPVDYCNLYLKRYLSDDNQNIAKDAKIIWRMPPAEKYRSLGETALTDGLFGGTTYVESWIGWEGTDGEFILDLGKEQTFCGVETDFLHQLGAWILLPQKVSYSISSDNINYSLLGVFKFEEDRDLAVKFASAKVIADKPVRARYIKVFVKGTGVCPPWHYGVGHPAWFFIDEVTVHSKYEEEKAPAPLSPTPLAKQVEWQKMETYAFVHFGLNTFVDKEWGYGDTDLNVFNPTHLDCEQWVQTFVKAGMKGVILTAKHHDGFCLWPSPLTGYSIKNTPYKDGKGDIVRELSDACKKYGIKFGIYLSPWDRHQANYGTPEYREYFHRQLHELLTNYDDIFEVWFDGANGGDGWYGGAKEVRKIDRRTYYDYPRAHRTIEQLHPQAIIFSDGGPGCRWVGNEEGYADATNWSFIREGEVYAGSGRHRESQHGHADGNLWVPAECNTSIRPGWFYHEREDDKVKTPEQLVDLYYRSVGHNGTFLLNFPIDRRGLIHPTDSANAVRFHQCIAKELSDNLLKRAEITATDERGTKFTVATLVDSIYDTYWATHDGTTSANLTFTFDRPDSINRLSIQEYIPLGQRIKSFTVEYEKEGKWLPIKCNEETTTIGYKRLLRFNPVKTGRLRIRFTDSRACLCLSEVGAFYAPGATKSYSVKTSALASFPFTMPGVDDTEQKKCYDKEEATTCFIQGTDEVLFDLHRARTIHAFYYLPDQSSYGKGIISSYQLSAGDSPDNMTIVAEGEFSNILNNPICQEIYFAPMNVRYLKLKAVRTTNNNQIIGLSEIAIQ